MLIKVAIILLSIACIAAIGLFGLYTVWRLVFDDEDSDFDVIED